MARFLAKSEQLRAWDGDVPSESGTYLIVEVVETLRVGSVSARSQAQQTQQSPQKAREVAREPAKQAKQKKTIEVSDDDLEEIEVPLKPEPAKTEKPKRGVIKKGSTVFVNIGGKTFRREFPSDSKANMVSAQLESMMDSADCDDKEVANQLSQSKNWIVG